MTSPMESSWFRRRPRIAESAKILRDAAADGFGLIYRPSGIACTRRAASGRSRGPRRLSRRARRPIRSGCSTSSATSASPRSTCCAERAPRERSRGPRHRGRRRRVVAAPRTGSRASPWPSRSTASARSRIRSSRSTASARSASRPARRGTRVLVVPASCAASTTASSRATVRARRPTSSTCSSCAPSRRGPARLEALETARARRCRRRRSARTTSRGCSTPRARPRIRRA